jgi:aldose 1-epimerase
MKTGLIWIFAILVLVSCMQEKAKPTIDPKGFDKTVEGKKVALYTMKNRNGLEMSVTNYGGRIVSFLAPDKNGKMEDVVLGYDGLENYLDPKNNYGAAIGRYGNRIANGLFSLGDIQYKLAQNNGPNCLHGGVIGFSSKVWDAELKKPNELELTLISPDMDEGFPGELKVVMTYKLTDENELVINYSATTDRQTVCNLTNHSYFNLHGAGNGDVLDHILYINADAVTAVDSVLIPTGEILPVAGTPLDFKTPTAIGARIKDDNQQLKFGGGYDQNYVLNVSEPGLFLAASVYEPVSGRFLEVFTDQPGLQLYTGNFLTGEVPGKGGKIYNYRSAVCLETQCFPDSPNQPEFPTVVLNPGETYSHTCIYKFSVK